ncbi:protein TBATA isoform X3 [Microcebus murinus]|uniref:protein TBATA isoform X3 n=1 Tax=Microcebus murinus TaxID=30608 RepID=UPI003F6CE1EE
MEQTQGLGELSPHRVPGQHALLSISGVCRRRRHRYSSKGTPSSQGQWEKGVQKAKSPKAEPKLEKKSGQRPRSHEEDGPQKDQVTPGVMDLELAPEALRTPNDQTPGAYRFGRLSHHSFFSRHHPHPQRVTHIPDTTGKPICIVKDEFSLGPLPQSTLLASCVMPTISAPLGDPQSNRNPQLASDTWKKELKELASQVAFFTKENEQRKNKESWQPPQGPPEPACQQGRRSPDHPAGSGAADPGASLSDLADRLIGSHPVLAALRFPQGERPCPGTSADGRGSILAPASDLHSCGKTPKPARRSSRLSTGKPAAAALQSIPKEDENIASSKKRKARVHWEGTSSPDSVQSGHGEEDV